jgi:hypothetical protein
MKKRGQVTIFIILGIVLISTIGIFLYFSEFNLRSLIGMGTESVPSEVLPIHQFVSDCVKTTGENTLYLIGQQGGYSFFDSYILANSLEIGIPYYFDGENTILPGKGTIEEQIGRYMDLNMFFCTTGFIDFPDFEVAQNGINTEVIILENIVNIEVNYPLNIKKGDTIYQLSEFKETFNIRLGTIYKTAEEITSFQEQNPPEICLSCIIDLGIENDLNINIEDYGEDTVIFTIADQNSILFEDAYKFVFANKYP